MEDVEQAIAERDYLYQMLCFAIGWKTFEIGTNDFDLYIRFANQLAVPDTNILIDGKDYLYAEQFIT